MDAMIFVVNEPFPYSIFKVGTSPHARAQQEETSCANIPGSTLRSTKKHPYPVFHECFELYALSSSS